MFLPVNKKEMLERARTHREEHTYTATNFEEFEKTINEKPGFIKAMWCGDEACEVSLKEIGGLKSRCILEEEQPTHKCAMCGKDAKHRVVWGIQY